MIWGSVRFYKGSDNKYCRALNHNSLWCNYSPPATIAQKQPCTIKTLLTDTEVGLSYGSQVSWNFILLLLFFQSLSNVKMFLGPLSGKWSRHFLLFLLLMTTKKRVHYTYEANLRRLWKTEESSLATGLQALEMGLW